MFKTIAIIGIMALIFFLTYLGSGNNRLTRAVVCSGLVAAIGFGGSYFVDFIGNPKTPSHKHKIVSSEKENIMDATCTDAGSYELVSFCECGEELSKESFPIEPLGHDYAEIIKDPSCDESGFTTYICNRCKSTYEDDYTDALGHDFIKGICSRCGEIDPDNEASTTATPLDSEKHLKDTAYTAKKVNFITYSGTINSEKQTDSYELATSISGLYRFYMSDMVNGFEVKVYVYDSAGNEIGGTYGLGNNEGITCELEKKNNYTIKVMNYSNTGNYTLNIAQPKNSIDITNFEVINDYIEYTEQQNNYTFVPSISGIYRFELSEIISGFKLKLYVYDSLDYEIGGSYGLGNYEGTTVDLTAGETYTIKIIQYENSGSYILSIGKQRATIDISGKTKISGNIAYTDQQIIYTYTPSISGEYTMLLQDMLSDFKVKLYVHDSLDYEISGTYGLENNDEITAELTAGKTYTIYLIQYKNYGDFSLNISS
ncbi:MAG: hypothetical protein HFJ09_04010 [Lachnospiraceae bacterium]|nr:hypothetical protein [Lachnospiraceae bacterium]